MVFSIVVILLVALVAYFHFVQGFFSATLSAIIAAIAALMAISYNETVVSLLLKGKMADVAHSFVLCAIFAVVYIVLRLLFDSAVPGNVRLPATIDKIGAALMGVICGIFAVGIFAIAVQMLPFGPTVSLMLYSRYPTGGDRDVVIPVSGGGQQLDGKTHDELTDSTITDDADGRAKQVKLWFPVDDLLLNMVYRISDGGSLAGDRTLASIHPDYLQELFGERLGQQDGARRSALVGTNGDAISLGGVYTAASLPLIDGESKLLRPGDFVLPKDKKIDSIPGRQILVVRVNVHSTATDDEDGIFRFSPGSIHLVAHPTEPTPHDQDYYPIGMLENGNTLLLDKPDDFLFLNLKAGDASFDAVFIVDNGVIVGSDKKDVNQIADHTFVSVKRFGLVDLSGQKVIDPIAPPTTAQLMHPKVYTEQMNLPPAPAPTAAAPTPAPTPTAQTPSPTTPVTPTPSPTPAEPAKPTATARGSVSSSIAFSIGCKTDKADDANVTVAGGTISLTGGNISLAQINQVDPAELAKGDTQLKELAVPDGYKLVQVSYSTTAANPYAWSDQLGAISLTDSNNNSYKANGVIVKTDDKVMVRYDMNHTSFALPSLTGAPTSTIFLFVIRSSTHITSLQVGTDTTPVSVDVP
jgi:hypothetical protein